MRQYVSALLKEIQFVPELGLNRENVLNTALGALNHQQKGGKKKMNLKLLTKAIVVSALIAVVASVGFAQAGYLSVEFQADGPYWGWVNAQNSIVYDDSTYYINWGSSSQSATYDFWMGDYWLVESRDTRNQVNSEVFAKVYFSPWFDYPYEAWAQAWSYPSYLQLQAGGGSDWYFA